MLKYLPNALTTLRLLLALPLGLLILRHHYALALWIGLLAGITDALDGFTARRLGYFSQFGAALDPVADKLLIMVTFLCFAQIELVPWYVATIVVGRDLIIVSGALCYRVLVGPIHFAATALSKINMLVQICFCVMLLAAQLTPLIGPQVIQGATVLVLMIAVVSGLDYVVTWTRKAHQNQEPGN
ncbi:CDP-alcohol phosphatidyltransferase family protein [Pseudohalioglobus lutimaris]|uniref:CDP-diacylglycerol--glycerol-3-phosphate 3-phosphatidyltransferase n=1 Tax=Pseudohalioglobus lutimaris TaxID=1737061 RepID=A0A2N5X5G3_9GAMM|nr:CDP-alcohol phosphatidyltransferase family protein [Pseudohalioglobus lutimaris]PLW69724.1 CDP-alcohol phosphatidyltransferase family protein [Pseudohalioglobus lutimaris]